MPNDLRMALPIVEFEVAAHRSGLGLFTITYLPGIPIGALSEDEARKRTSFIRFAITKDTCDKLAPMLLELGRRLSEAKHAKH